MSEHETKIPDDGPTIPYYIPPPKAAVAAAAPAETPAAGQMQVPAYVPPGAYTAPANTYAPPPTTYAPPSTYAAPSNTYAAPPNTYAPPANPYPAAPSGFGTPYAPPLNAYPPASPYGGSPYPSCPPPSGPAVRPKLERYAIIALITSLVGILLFSIPLGIAAVARTKGGIKRGRGLAVTSLVLSLAWIMVLVAVFAFHAGRKPTRAADGAITHQGSFSPVNLRVGDCFLTQALAQGQTEQINTVTVLPCSSPHNAQVFYSFQSKRSTFPSEAMLLSDATPICTRHALSYLGQPSAALSLIAFVPNARLWSIGNRTESCVLVDGGANITGDMRGH